MPCLAVCGACDTHGKARLQLSELQQDDGQVVDEEQGIHQGDGVLDDSLIVVILTTMVFILHFKEPQDQPGIIRYGSDLDVYDTKGMNETKNLFTFTRVMTAQIFSVDFILAHLCVKDSDAIEEPVGHHKQQH